MVSFRPNASRAPSPQALQPRPCEQGEPRARIGHAAGGPIDDAAIRRDFEALAGRIRLLQQRAAREAARLAG